ncbi:uncharacterized protein LOC130649421 [Hydractinia symbiolongicarpus]|uniref:uncharacterized protein LOC130649421 n=1 Tax=Hydractinia symbiolongicarpus TaxID=13093 RepID=UPI002549FFF3|nr:uncharacterized protein LOC130649421 [Hydractinia symbiolongicarpus]
MLGGDDGYIYNLDTQLSASVKKIMLQRINFKEAAHPDHGSSFHHKYKPLNAGYKPGQIKREKNKCAVQNDIPKPSVVLFPEERIVLHWKEIRRIGPGLGNMGNTCFLNSVLQVLTYTPPLANYLLSCDHKNKCQCVGFCMQCELIIHITRIFHHNPQHGCVRPSSIIGKLSCIGKTFRVGRQEDAHEFLRYVVEGIQKSDYAGKQLDKASKETTVANAIFGGYCRSQVKCLHCHHESNTFDPIMDINLDIKECSNILQSLNKFVRPDRLDGDNKYFCERCRTKRVAQKRETIHREPNVLTLQLKRFDYSKMFGGKISKDIHFPDAMNIRPFMSNTQGEPVHYDLYSVLVHSGYSCNSGHYYCYVKAPNGSWYEMNDNRVCSVGWHVVKNAQAYLLFYVKKKLKTKNSYQQQVINQPAQVNTSLHAAQNVKMPLKTPNPIGAPVQRKIEPKIIWNKSKPSNSGSVVNNMEVKGSADALLKEKAAKLSATFSPFKIKTTDNKVDSEKKVASEKKINSLQKLSLSYGAETDSGSSSNAPSPVLHSTPGKVDILAEDVNNSLQDEDSKTDLKRDKLSLPLHLHNEPAKEKTSPIRIKLNHGKHYTPHSKFNIWSPITKGALHPRVIINRCLTNADGEKTPGNESKGKILKEENLRTLDKVSAPVMPPQSITKRHRNNSITSEASSTNSIPSQSGEWDILDKQTFLPSAPVIPERQHVGWDVSKVASSSATDRLDDTCFQNISEGKQKKKKKKIRKEESEPLLSEDTWVEISKESKNRKRKHEVEYSISNTKGLMEVSSLAHSDEEDATKKKKKKKKKLKHKNEKNDSLDSSTAQLWSTKDCCDEDKDRHEKKKKKKKKHKRKHSDLENNKDVDTRYNYFSNVEKTFQRIKLGKKSASKNDLKYHRLSSKVSEEDSLTSDEGNYKHRNGRSSSPGRVFKNHHSIHKSKSHTSLHSRRGRSPEPKLHKTKSGSRDSSPHSNSESFRNRQTGTRESSDREVSLSSKSRRRNSDHEKGSVNKRYSNKHRSFDLSPLSDHDRDHSSDDKREFKNHEGHQHSVKKNVPCHMWDEEKKKVNIWDGSNKTKTVDYLLSNTTEVSSWNGADNSDTYRINNRPDGERRQDEWDEEYDVGKMKKQKKSRDGFEYSKSNAFQELQNYRNYTKDAHVTHRSPTKHNRQNHGRKFKKDFNRR